jgi:hypothetical protein
VSERSEWRREKNIIYFLERKGTYAELLLAALEGVDDVLGQRLEGVVDSLGDVAAVPGGEVLEDVSPVVRRAGGGKRGE